MSLFERPHRCFSACGVVMGLKNEALREVDDYSTWVARVEDELATVYGDQVAHLSLADIFYATRDAPTTFSSRISDEMFQRLREYKAIVAQIADVSAQLTEQMKAQELAEAQLAAAREAREPVRQLQRNLRAIKAKVAQLGQQADNLSYERACLSQQLGNVFRAEPDLHLHKEIEDPAAFLMNYTMEINGRPPAKRPRPELPADLPLSTSSIPEVQTLIEENNRQTRPKYRRGQRDFLNYAFDTLGMVAKDDPSKLDVVLAFLAEMATKHGELPRNTAVSKVLYAWCSSPDLIDAGLHIVTSVLDYRVGREEAFQHSFDERVAAVALRLAVQAANVDFTLIRRIIDALPADAFKRRVFQPLFAHCNVTANVHLCFEFFDMARAKNLELWDTDYHNVLSTIAAAAATEKNSGGRPVLTSQEVKLYVNRVLAEMAQQHPVVGAANAALIQNLLSGEVASVDKDGICSRCGRQLQSFDLSLEDRAVLVHDVVEKLVKPRVESSSRYVPDADFSEETKQQRWKEFDAFKAVVAEMNYDTVIDGANVGYYGLSSWYTEAKDTLLRSRGVDPASVPADERYNVPFPVDVSPKFSLIEDMRVAAEKHGKKAIIVLHNRHLENPTPENVPFVGKWAAMGALLPSPGFLNDDYCWLYAVLTRQDSCIISNDQMRDHHFSMLQPRFFMRWRQRHRITYKAMYDRFSKTATLRIHLPRAYSVWVQQVCNTGAAVTAQHHHWHVPYIAGVDILHQATNQTTSTSADVELGKDGDDACSDWICTNTVM